MNVLRSCLIAFICSALLDKVGCQEGSANEPPEDQESDEPDDSQGGEDDNDDAMLRGRSSSQSSNACDSSPCGDNGKCTPSIPYKCACENGYTGESCENPPLQRSFINACFPRNPCRAGETCIVTGSGSEYRCQSQTGSTGGIVHQPSGNPCDPNPCSSDSFCQVVGGMFLCSPRGGPSNNQLSVTSNPCVPNPCRAGQTCNVDGGSFRCFGVPISNQPFCNPPCVNGDCRSSFGSNVCSCRPGWTGPQCNTLSNPCVPNPCQPGQTCNVAPGGGTYRCFDNPVTNQPICNPRCIHGICRSGGLATVCHCNRGYTGRDCGHLISPRPRSSCNPSPCLNRGQCRELANGGFQCICPPNFSGTLCQTSSTPVCSPPCINGVCRLLGGRATCQCNPGFSGPTCGNNPCVPNPCPNGATCNVKPGGVGYKCFCPPGLLPPNCTPPPPNSCVPNPCQNGGSCNVNPGGVGYTCSCPSGYLPPLCDRNLCFPNPCQNGGTCNVNPGNRGYTCNCPSGYQPPLCLRSPCVPNPCQNGGRCNVNPGGAGYTCTCPPGFLQPLCGRSPCVPNPCQNGGTCNVNPGGAGYTCNCPSGYQPPLCVRNPCVPNPCQNGGRCNVNPGGAGYTCTCPAGFLPPLCGRSPCVPNPCQNGGTCNVNPGGAGFTCTCPSGYIPPRCTSPCIPNPCLNGGSCNINPGGTGYTCFCPTGYLQPNCLPSPCVPNPCRNGGTCNVNTGGGPVCQCAPQWTGPFCTVPVTPGGPCTPNPCRGDCMCRESCRHSSGYFCQGTTGYLGKNCTIQPPSIICGSNSIDVSVNSAIVREYDSGLGGFVLFMSPSHDMSSAGSCPAQLSGSVYVIRLALPFTTCGTTPSTDAYGKSTFSNTIWMNRRLASGQADMPVPIVHFKCIYEKQYSIVTSLQPSIGAAPTITSRGQRSGSGTIELCKSGASCPGTCPVQYTLTQGAVYTVGEKLHLIFRSQAVSSGVNLHELFLSCQPDISAVWTNAPVVLLRDGCLASADGRYLPTTVRPFGSVICSSFQVPKLTSCTDFYIHAKLLPCTVCTSAYAPCQSAGRRKRTPAPSGRLQVLGPIYVIDGENGTATRIMYPDKNYVNSTSGVLVLKDDFIQPPDSSTNLPLSIALGVLLFLALVIFVVLLLHNWHLINAHCGRKF